MLTKNLTLIAILIGISINAIANIRLPKLISDGMVLQRDVPVNIWGWADAGEIIVIRFNQGQYQVVADHNGNWNVQLDKLGAGGPYKMVLLGKNRIEINDIWMGDVWVCSGQSNMELNMQRAAPLYVNEMAHCDNPQIRQFVVPQVYNFNQPQTDFQGGSWVSVNTATIGKFSAVAYFFARELNFRFQVPVGIINASLGGSPAEAWISEDALKSFPDYYNILQKYKSKELIDSIEAADRNRSQQWYNQLAQTDLGCKNQDLLWKNGNQEHKEWQEITVPGYWEKSPLKGVNGVVWYRRSFNLDSLEGMPAYLELGRIVDADSVFINGQFVGTTSYQYPPRRYHVPSGILVKGENKLVVKVISNSGTGGFVPDKNYSLTINRTTIDLTGEWQFRIGATMPSLASQTFVRWQPGGLFNAMIYPMTNYTVKGFAWYQGESNVDRYAEYEKLLTSLVNCWRGHWQQGELPFIITQLPNFMERWPEPTESNWARFREQQFKALSIPNSALAVTIDLGEWNDIHPLNKKDVGVRMAKAAANLAYGDDQSVYTGPLFRSFEIQGDKIIISFNQVGAGLQAKGGEGIKGFAIAGKDKKFVWASAKIEGDKIFVWHPKISKPVAVRYGWADNPECNLYNLSGFPASPFRTDEW